MRYKYNEQQRAQVAQKGGHHESGGDRLDFGAGSACAAEQHQFSNRDPQKGLQVQLKGAMMYDILDPEGLLDTEEKRSAAAKTAEEVHAFLKGHLREDRVTHCLAKVEMGANFGVVVVPQFEGMRPVDSNELFGSGAECRQKFSAFERSLPVLGFSPGTSFETVLRSAEAIHFAADIMRIWATVLVCPETLTRDKKPLRS